MRTAKSSRRSGGFTAPVSAPLPAPVTASLLALMLTVAAGAPAALAGAAEGVAAFERGDYAAAAEEFRKDEKAPLAALYLGRMHEAGLGGLMRNESLAFSWYSRAAAAGDVTALRAVADMYDSGRGVPKSERKAAEALRKAADAGDAESQAALGIRYRDGRGVPRDLHRAMHWLGTAAGQGDPGALSALDAMRDGGQVDGSTLAALLTGVADPSAPLSAEGTALRAELEALLEPLLSLPADPWRPGPTGDGATVRDRLVVVEREGAVFGIVPDLSVRRDDAVVEVGTIRVRLDAARDGLHPYRVTMPDAFVIRDDRRRAVGRVSFGGLDMTGRWSAVLAAVTDSRLRAETVSLRDDIDGGTVRIESLDLATALDQVRPAEWRQTVTAGVVGLRTAPESVDRAASIGRLALKAEFEGHDAGALARALMPGGRAVPEAGGPRAGLPRRVAFEATVENLAFDDAASGTGGTLASGRFRFGGTALDTAAAEVGLGFGYEGLSVGDAGAPAAGRPAPPEALDVGLAVERLPLGALVGAIVGEALRGAAAAVDPRAPGGGNLAIAGVGVPVRALGVLADAGTRIRLDRFDVRSGEARLRASGAFDVDPAAAFQVVGAVDVAVAGLDAWLADPGWQALPPEVSARLRAWARPGEEAGTVRFRLDLDSTGAATVNDRPLADLLAPSGTPRQ